MDREADEYKPTVAFFAVDWPPVVYLRRRSSDVGKLRLGAATDLRSTTFNTLVQLLQRRSSAVIRALGRISRVLKHVNRRNLP